MRTVSQVRSRCVSWLTSLSATLVRPSFLLSITQSRSYRCLAPSGRVDERVIARYVPASFGIEVPPSD
jgi:hypothetical protein